MALTNLVTGIISRVTALRPVRVYLWYASRTGPLLAAGLSFQGIFALFAAIWVGFSIAGLIVSSDTKITETFVELLRTNVPGLIGGSDSAAINPDTLLSSSILGWTGAVAAAGLLMTALGWLASGRDAVRRIFDLPAPPQNILLLKIKDLGVALAFMGLLAASAALSVLSTSMLSIIMQWWSINPQSEITVSVVSIAGTLITVLIDTVILGAFYRVLSGIRIPLRHLAQGTILGASALGAIKITGSSLLGGAMTNPLLASFAVIVGLLIWFNLICQVILLGAAWIAVAANDMGIDLSETRRPPAAAVGTSDAAVGNVL
ncbi:MAG: YihY/virulence factor BrkB family protein [Rhodoglobus sp.]